MKILKADASKPNSQYIKKDCPEMNGNIIKKDSGYEYMEESICILVQYKSTAEQT